MDSLYGAGSKKKKTPTAGQPLGKSLAISWRTGGGCLVMTIRPTSYGAGYSLITFEIIA